MNTQNLDSEIEKVVNEYYATITTIDNLNEFKKQRFRKALRTIAEKTVEAVRVEGLNEFLEHSTDCILSWCEAGRPTKDGYEQKYRGVWYQSRPIDNTPKCDCGLAELLTEQTNLANQWLGKE